MSRTHDPRALRSRAAALAAATQLLVEGGPERVTHAAVAQRAGVGRATVYRHWPDTQSLFLDAVAVGAHPLLAFGEGRVRDQLVTQLQQQAEWLNQPVSASVIASVIERAERDEGIRRVREEMFGRTDEQVNRMLSAAVEHGELRAGVEGHARELAARILGPLLFQRFMLGVPLTADMVTDSVDAALEPWLSDAPAFRTPAAHHTVRPPAAVPRDEATAGPTKS